MWAIEWTMTTPFLFPLFNIDTEGGNSRPNGLIHCWHSVSSFRFYNHHHFYLHHYQLNGIFYLNKDGKRFRVDWSLGERWLEFAGTFVDKAAQLHRSSHLIQSGLLQFDYLCALFILIYFNWCRLQVLIHLVMLIIIKSKRMLNSLVNAKIWYR